MTTPKPKMRVFFACTVTLAAALAIAPARAAEPAFATAPAKGTVSAVRLLSAGPLEGGAYRAGVEISLAPKTATYWRQPGEAGSPPVFDFSKSINVAKVETAFPAPKHLDEAGTIVAGYDETVIFPLKVTPKDPKAPVTLALDLDYAACGKICLPAKAELSLVLPQSGASPFASAINAAEKRVPVKISGAEAAKRLSLKKDGDSWRLSVTGPGMVQDVFAEVADPLFIESKREGANFALTLFSTGPKPKSANATLTIITEREAFEAPAHLE
ncbi:protein-disulfide reductase DsbD domain-containing protein [Methylocystis sp. JR02]|uniref:protein-disulfide reductase DsbD domain-containing protein n=1 Tax=Methylocystis sp. JR02 TaxID=3046284 RepID=UPI0024B87822|nr:protein-disulfide reductase DsbD domain-containing protein [Methylocystis sp. JR02]MDJ0449393.1 protein-disulfide reductase DsbD family protein [Methylocystis sp. JR02]